MWAPGGNQDAGSTRPSGVEERLVKSKGLKRTDQSLSTIVHLMSRCANALCSISKSPLAFFYHHTLVHLPDFVQKFDWMELCAVDEDASVWLGPFRRADGCGMRVLVLLQVLQPLLDAIWAVPLLVIFHGACWTWIHYYVATLAHCGLVRLCRWIVSILCEWYHGKFLLTLPSVWPLSSVWMRGTAKQVAVQNVLELVWAKGP